MSSPEDEENCGVPRRQITHHILLRPSEFPVMHSDSLDSEELEDDSEEDESSMDLPENTRNFNLPWKINKCWLKEILIDNICKTDEEREAFQIDHFTLKSGSEPVLCQRHAHHENAGLVIGDSALSEVLSVRVEYRLKQDQPSSLDLVIKLPPRDPVSRFFVTEAQFDLREIKFYTQVVPELLEVLNKYSDGTNVELPIPRCLHATYRTQPHHSVLVLENLKSRGYRGANFAEGLTLSQTRAALRSLARVHALSLVLKYRERTDLTERYPFLFRTCAATDSYQQLVERGLPQLSRFLERRGALDQNDETGEDYSHILFALTKIRSQTRHVISTLLAPREPLSLITHTDFWCSNLLFTSSTSEGPDDQGDDDDTNETMSCAILDWQMITYSHPANDLALLIISSLDSDLRRAQTNTLLDYYLKNLEQECTPLGVSIAELGYTNDMLHEDFKRSQLLALLLCIGSVDVALGDVRTEERLLHVLKDLYDDGIFTNYIKDIDTSEQ